MSRWLLLLAAVVACSADEERNDRFRGSGGDAGAGAATTSAGPGGASTTSTTGGGGTTSTTTTTTSSAGGACNDPYPEPNDTEADAVYLGAIDDCDGSGMMLDGVLAGDDVDWWTYDGIDDVGCVVDGDRQFSSQGGSIRVCKYFDCPGVAVTCPSGTSPDNSPDGGLPGCCSQSGFNVAPDCNGLDESSYVFIRVDKQPIDPCVSYSLAYHY